MTAPYPWLRVYASMLTDRRVLAVASDLGRTEAEVLGYLVALMLWAGEHAQDGVIRPTMPGGEAVIIERAVHWRGRAGRLSTALLAHGLLVDHAEGLVLADWQEQQGAHIAKLERDRATADAKRAAKKSANARATPAGPSQDGRAMVARESRDGRAGVVRQEGERREERKKEDSPAAGAADASPAALTLTSPEAPAVTPAKPPRKPSATEALALRLQTRRAEALPDAAPDPLPAPARLNTTLGALVRQHGEPVVEAAHAAFLRAEKPQQMLPPCPLNAFTSAAVFAIYLAAAQRERPSRPAAAPVTGCAECGKPSMGLVWETPTCGDCMPKALEDPKGWGESHLKTGEAA